ncbi:hypothetical protein C8A03DRAFT_46014 [Achaetomium macrosporum]|uniref:Uncharacterized protein n=1 Tax=Achaetomium macrosporum TaxID=79813 RepID=A0AAN7H940_9PEZI|nr:hypothetical protein C8A03DRAFT_46014 [Achaetomium macrosporum]
MLAVYLLNGEIIYNGRTEETHRLPSLTTVSVYLRTHFFNQFHGPRIDRSLINKSCRFINVKLNARGIMTKGHLWKLGRMKPRSSLTPWRSDFPRRYIRMEAKRLVKAIDGGETLRFGSLWGRRDALTPYNAIFIWEDGDDGREIHANQQEVPSFVFTASRPKQPNSRTVGTNDIDHHVSLEVRFTDLDVEHRVPRLYVRRWLSGLCLFNGCPRNEVIFPWPPSVETIIP